MSQETNDEVMTLIEQKDTMQSEIYKAENKIRTLTEKIKEIDKLLFKKCKHKWKYDHGCAFDEHTKHFCSVCGVWKNYYWYA